MKKIVIQEPRIFFSYMDERSFYKWLHSIPAITKLAPCNGGLELELGYELDEAGIRDIIAIMHRYEIDKRCLRLLVTDENESWMKNPNAYWYESIFGK